MQVYDTQDKHEVYVIVDIWGENVVTICWILESHSGISFIVQAEKGSGI